MHFSVPLVQWFCFQGNAPEKLRFHSNSDHINASLYTFSVSSNVHHKFTFHTSFSWIYHGQCVHFKLRKTVHSQTVVVLSPFSLRHCQCPFGEQRKTQRAMCRSHHFSSVGLLLLKNESMNRVIRWYPHLILVQLTIGIELYHDDTVEGVQHISKTLDVNFSFVDLIVSQCQVRKQSRYRQTIAKQNHIRKYTLWKVSTPISGSAMKSRIVDAKLLMSKSGTISTDAE